VSIWKKTFKASTGLGEKELVASKVKLGDDDVVWLPGRGTTVVAKGTADGTAGVMTETPEVYWEVLKKTPVTGLTPPARGRAWTASVTVVPVRPSISETVLSV
jgi:hypothetical protein